MPAARPGGGASAPSGPAQPAGQQSQPGGHVNFVSTARYSQLANDTLLAAEEAGAKK